MRAAETGALRRIERGRAERAQTERLETFYVRAQSPVMRAVERRMCGCDYGGCSWTTRDEAERVSGLLDLKPGACVLDLGSGSGWPGLYLATISGGDVILLDLPISGLRIAANRARADGMAGQCRSVVGEASCLPFSAGAIAAIHHSDLLCCLVPKRAVLAECRRVIASGGRMVFSVISIAPGLGSKRYRRALEGGPEFVETKSDYATLLRETGWTAEMVDDLTGEFEAASRRQVEAYADHADELSALVGQAEYEAGRTVWSVRLAAVSQRLLQRELFVATPG